MYHQNHYMIEILAKARQEQLLEYAMQSNLSKTVRPKRSTFPARVIFRFGELLITLGTLIKDRYQPEIYTASVDFRADGTNSLVS